MRTNKTLLNVFYALKDNNDYEGFYSYFKSLNARELKALNKFANTLKNGTESELESRCESNGNRQTFQTPNVS